MSYGLSHFSFFVPNFIYRLSVLVEVVEKPELWDAPLDADSATLDISSVQEFPEVN